MSASELQFRTSTLGGFHKQDVLTYIETSSRTHTEKVEQLTCELKEALEGKAVAENTAQEQTNRVAELTMEKSKLVQNLSAKDAELEALQANLEEQGKKILALEDAAKELQDRLEKAEPNASLYECIKDRTAGVELEALRRAQEIEDDATAHAKRTKDELEQWMENVQNGYKALREDMEQTIAQAKKELEEACATVELIPEEFAAGDVRLEQLLDSCSPVVKMPMPLEE